MNRIMSRLFSSLVLAVMLVFLTGTAYSQTDSTMTHRMDKQRNSAYQNAKYDKDVSDAASKLKTQVNLSLEQTSRVEGILQDYKDNAKSTSTTASKDDTMDKVENVLTADQKTKFDNIKTQWWSTTKEQLTSNSTSPKMNKNEKK